MVEPGTILGGKYRVDRILGKGGMGVVVSATHVQLGTPLALKFLHPQLVENQRVTERFMREARASAQLKGEHVCRVYDVTVIDGAPCLVMEKLEGIDLAKLLRRQGPLPVTTVCDYLLQACAGVAEAHAAQIIHRDLKPGNLFLTSRTDGTPLIKILDFGVAKAFTETELDLTHTDMILGSPSYMSIEQIKSSKLADVRSDIWSLGVILYELVAGKRPFNGEGIANLALNIATEPAPPLPRGPIQLDVVIGRCLDKDPARRYQDVAELAAAIAPFASIEGRSLTSSIARVVRAGTSSGPMSGPVTTQMPGASPDEDSIDGVAHPSTIRAASGVMQPARAVAQLSHGRLGWLIGGLAAVGILVGAMLGMRAGNDGPQPAGEPDPIVMPASAAPAPPPAPVIIPVDAAVAAEPLAAPDAAVEQQVVPAVTTQPPPIEAPRIKRPKKPKPPRDVGESRI